MTSAIIGEWARLLLGSLAQCGVKDVVVSPGSRSTPFAWAAAHTPGLTIHSLYDERSAAFFALGMARVTAEPALLLCTSGSAAANYFPAVVEASLGHLPLLVMTADRPLELQDAGAPQTIDQVKLYGDFARGFFDLGIPDAAPSSLSALPRIAAQAALATRSPVPGPVHLNARARKPLEPTPPVTEHDRAVAAEVDRLLTRGAPRAFGETASPDARGIALLAERLSSAERGVVVCGPLPLGSEAGSIAALAGKLSMPLYAEATSQLRFGDSVPDGIGADAFDWALRSHVSRTFAPSLVLRFGGTPAAAGIDQLLDLRGPTELCVVAEHGLPDPSNSAAVVVRGSPAVVARRLLEALSDHRPRPEQRAFCDLVMRANAATWHFVDSLLAPEDRYDAEGCFGEPRAVRCVVDRVRPGDLLMLGNSLPVREVDHYVRSGLRNIGVLCQRGSNGIDGLISGAAGAALAARRPTVLLVGDVSFAHDLGGLAAARKVDVPLVIVVLDNDGGRIFEGLPVARLFDERPESSELWLTPPRLELEHAARSFGLPYACPAGPAELGQNLGEALERPGPSIVHVRLAPHGTREASVAIGHGILSAEFGSEAQ
jgi:2-succinyl-5-enolpyruvyl-6-hydroxy-3-cyclohexene-1-carboxylate synthase